MENGRSMPSDGLIQKMFLLSLLVTGNLTTVPSSSPSSSSSSSSSSSPSRDDGHHSSDQVEQVCRDRFGTIEVPLFRRRACVLCYRYLFRSNYEEAVDISFFQLAWRRSPTPQNGSGSGSGSGSGLGSGSNSLVVVSPDPTNETSLDEVCQTLRSGEECRRWRECCMAGKECCDRQMEKKMQRRMAGKDAEMDEAAALQPRCASTWDGYACWDSTPRGTNVTQQCPLFISLAIASQESSKFCTENGTWYTSEGWEWTDFTSCLESQGYLTPVHVAVALSVISLALLVPAIVIFAVFRDLYRQQRIRLHMHFFVSLTLVSLINIFWYILVHKELILSLGNSESVVRRNPVWCRVLSFMKIYLTSTTYFWMFFEGYHLHRLISNAFEAPASMLGIYLIGWLVPLVVSIIYASVRAAISNSSCWTMSAGFLQWIIYLPNLICLIVNLLFLCNILRTLMFQLHAHPHEPSNFRRGLKAGFMLIPLFGIQLLLTIYNPDVGQRGVRVFEVFTFVVTHSQGICVSLIFCFFNGEVLAQFRRIMPCSRKRDDWLGGASHGTHVTMAEARRDDVVIVTPTTEDTSRLNHRDPVDDYEGYCDAIPMKELGVKGQCDGIGYQAVPSKAVD